MKHVTKGLSEPQFEAWKALANADWSPTYKTLQNPEKSALHNQLLEEQGWVCCYCGRTIEQSSSHIEHFRPQEHYEHLELEHRNLFASCIRETEPGTPLHCGHAKGAGFDEALHISPLDVGCENRFTYTTDGRILSNDESDEQTKYMINLLRIDIAFLRNRRESEINSVFDVEFLSTVSEEELRRLRDAYRSRDSDGKLHSFGHVLARFAEQRLMDIPV